MTVNSGGRVMAMNGEPVATSAVSATAAKKSTCNNYISHPERYSMEVAILEIVTRTPEASCPSIKLIS